MCLLSGFGFASIAGFILRSQKRLVGLRHMKAGTPSSNGFLCHAPVRAASPIGSFFPVDNCKRPLVASHQPRRLASLAYSIVDWPTWGR
jgi:hypothetical protein